MNSAIQKALVSVNNKVAIASGETPQFLNDITKDISPRNLLFNGDFEFWSAGGGAGKSPDGWSLIGASASGERENYDFPVGVKRGQFALQLTRNGTDCYFYQNVAPLTNHIEYYIGRQVTLSVWAYATVANRVRIFIGTDISNSDFVYHTGDSTWQLLTVTYTVPASSTYLRVHLSVANGDTVGWFDAGMMVEGSSPLSYSHTPLYSQGVWTLSFDPQTSGTITLDSAVRVGRWVKVGKLVTITGAGLIDSVSSPLGVLWITGLPFPIADNIAGGWSDYCGCAVNSSIADAQGYFVGGASRIYVNGTGISAASFPAGHSIMVGGSYITD